MKTLDVNNYGVQEMNAGEMRENNGGMLFGVEKTQGLAFIDSLGIGYYETTTTYVLGIAVSSTTQKKYVAYA